MVSTFESIKDSTYKKDFSKDQLSKELQAKNQKPKNRSIFAKGYEQDWETSSQASLRKSDKRDTSPSRILIKNSSSPRIANQVVGLASPKSHFMTTNGNVYLGIQPMKGRFRKKVQ